MTDPDFFRDDDGRVYFYYGCSDVDPIMGVELDPTRRFDTIGQPRPLIEHKYQEYGWEAPGEKNSEDKKGWNEGAWMNKHEGKYYLQYAAPGTQFKVYGDGVYVADHPLGPFTYMPNNPFSYKPGGFISGAGHGSTFQDKYGNYWHVATMSISVRHMFERRVGLFPAFFDKTGALHCLTAFGDYPLYMPDRKMDYEKETLFTGWNLLSYHKPVTASSSMAEHPPELAVNEEVRNWWSAVTGNKGEWLQVDLRHNCAVQALQINFADQHATLKGGTEIRAYQYQVVSSQDGKHWQTLVDKFANKQDITHDYVVLAEPVKARYLKIINVQVAGTESGQDTGKTGEIAFSIAGFRIFGQGNGQPPAKVKTIDVQRKKVDGRKAVLSWNPVEDAVGYVVYYGNKEGNLFHSIMVYDASTQELTGLNRNTLYYFRVDACNENGVTKGVETGKY